MGFKLGGVLRHVQVCEYNANEEKKRDGRRQIFLHAVANITLVMPAGECKSADLAMLEYHSCGVEAVCWCWLPRPASATAGACQMTRCTCRKGKSDVCGLSVAGRHRCTAGTSSQTTWDLCALVMHTPTTSLHGAHGPLALRMVKDVKA